MATAAGAAVSARESFEDALSYSLGVLGLSPPSLKEEQRSAIWSMHQGRDVFVCLPTGYGKSLCYQTLPFVMDYKMFAAGLGGSGKSAVVVVSPLVALMEDQVRGLREKGVRTSIMSSSKAISGANMATEESLSSDSLFFCAPEILDECRWREAFDRTEFTERIVALVVDEAHCISKWSKEFRPAYGKLADFRALVPPHTPLMACTATATRVIREEILGSLEMKEFEVVSISPNRPNIMYIVRERHDPDLDLVHLLDTLRSQLISTPRVVVYCRTLTMIGDLFAHFSYEMGTSQYYPPGAPKLSDNRLFGMFHAKTPQHSKDIILQSLTDPKGIVRVVFASVAMGMGIDLKGVDTIIHYGAPSSIEDYFQASGRGGRSGASARSIVYWKPSDCPRRKAPVTQHEHEVNDVRSYVENSSVCRRLWLNQYFNSQTAKPGDDPIMCCDVCALNASLVSTLQI